MMKYEGVYKESKDLKDFIKKAHKKFPEVKIVSFKRRWYDLQKIKKESQVVVKKIEVAQDKWKQELQQVEAFLPEEISKPSHLKMLQFEDMKRLGKINEQILRRYGFKDEEIRWLIKNGYIQT